MNTKSKGNIGEIKIASEFIKWGCFVSFPFGDNARYDLVVDINGELKKVQVKYVDVKDADAYKCPCVSSKNHTTNKKLDIYKNDVDFICFYITEIDTCVIFPIKFIGDKKSINLRIDSAKNKQTKGIHFVKDHTFDKYFSTP